MFNYVRDVSFAIFIAYRPKTLYVKIKSISKCSSQYQPWFVFLPLCMHVKTSCVWITSLGRFWAQIISWVSFWGHAVSGVILTLESIINSHPRILECKTLTQKSDPRNMMDTENPLDHGSLPSRVSVTV